ncbi:hypothetical protein KCP77_03235 [Salmonella enterica subsp. enterica]|nr:hypothetical protein KCP77_03235 [Salmonella enterica subsp. enterica]
MLVRLVVVNRRSERWYDRRRRRLAANSTAPVLSPPMQNAYVRVLTFINDDVTFSLVFTPARHIVWSTCSHSMARDQATIIWFHWYIFQFQSQTAEVLFTTASSTASMQLVGPSAFINQPALR